MNSNIKSLLFVRIVGEKRHFSPAAIIEAEYELNADLIDTIDAVETSVIWYTEGKGDDDMGVHFFSRRRSDQLQHDRSLVYRFQSKLPQSPLSYIGTNLKIRWCVRVRVFHKTDANKGKMAGVKKRPSVATIDEPFQLGSIDFNKCSQTSSPPNIEKGSRDSKKKVV